jgi:hypothetical protein
MRSLRAIILFFYIVWAGVFFLPKTFSASPAVFAFLTFFQFFVPGFALGSCFGLLRRRLIEIILYSFILSYIAFLISTVPAMFLSVTWPLFIGINAAVYLIVLCAFLAKCTDAAGLKIEKPQGQEVLILLLGILIIATYSYINYRNDATYYNHIISASLESARVGDKLYSWQVNGSGALVKEPIKLFQLNYIQVYNFLALPIKYFSFDQRIAWLVYHKLFCFLSILSVYSLGRALFNPTCGYLSLLFYLVTVFPLGFYYYYPTGEMGLMFLQAGHAKQISQNIFLFAFYATLLSAFRDRNMKTFLFAGAILLAMLTIHQISFVYGIFSYIMFCLVLVGTAAFNKKGVAAQAVLVLKSGFYVALAPVVYLLALFFSSAYFNEFMFYHTQWSRSQWDDAGSMAIKNWGIFDKIKSLAGRAKTLIDISVVVGLPFWLRRSVRWKPALFADPGSLFLFSNLLLYLILKFPLFNLLTKFDFTTGRYVDALLLSYCILGFIISYALQKSKSRIKQPGFNLAVVILAILVYVLFGMNHGVSRYFRSRTHVAGDTYLKMTNYVNSISKGSGSGITVLTDMKSSIDAFAFLNAYVFQFEKATLYPYSLNKEKIDEIDRIVLSPQKPGAGAAAFIAGRRVDYIVVPTQNTPWVSGERADDNAGAVDFYDTLEGYRLIYSDPYYHVFNKRGEQ